MRLGWKLGFIALSLVDETRGLKRRKKKYNIGAIKSRKRYCLKVIPKVEMLIIGPEDGMKGYYSSWTITKANKIL